MDSLSFQMEKFKEVTKIVGMFKNNYFKRNNQMTYQDLMNPDLWGLVG